MVKVTYKHWYTQTRGRTHTCRTHREGNLHGWKIEGVEYTRSRTANRQRVEYTEGGTQREWDKGLVTRGMGKIRSGARSEIHKD